MRLRLVALALGLLAASAAPAAAIGPPGPAGPVVFQFNDGAGITGDLYVMNPDGTGRRPLTTTPSMVADLQPHFSSNGKTVFFRRIAGGAQDIYSINVDGSGVRNLTNTPDIPESSPEPSPDGKLVAYDESIASEFDVWVRRTDGSA